MLKDFGDGEVTVL